MVLLGAVFLYGCRVQREEIAPNNQNSNKNILLEKVKNWYQNTKRMQKNNSVSPLIPRNFSPQFSLPTDIKSECGLSLMRISFKDTTNNDKYLYHKIKKGSKDYIGYPELIVRETKDGFSAIISITTMALDSQADFWDNNYFEKKSNFTGVDYFFSVDGTQAFGGNQYQNGVFAQQIERVVCFNICNGEPTGTGGGSPSEPLLIVTQVCIKPPVNKPKPTKPICSDGQAAGGKEDGDKLERCTIICMNLGGNNNGDPADSGSGNWGGAGGGSSNTPPKDTPLDPTCPTGDCCGNENDLLLDRLSNKEKSNLTTYEWESLENAFADVIVLSRNTHMRKIVEYLIKNQVKIKWAAVDLPLEVSGKLVPPDSIVINKKLFYENDFASGYIKSVIFEELIHAYQYHYYPNANAIPTANIEFEAKLLLDYSARISDRSFFSIDYALSKPNLDYDDWLDNLLDNPTEQVLQSKYEYFLSYFYNKFPIGHPYRIDTPNYTLFPQVIFDIIKN